MRIKTNIIHFAFAVLVIACFAFSLQAQPAPETPDPGSVGGSFNTADGTNALNSVTTGVANSAFGWFSLFSNTDGSFNTGVGAGTLLFNVGDQSTGEGISNTAVGAAALLLNTSGSFNTAFGDTALVNNTTGHRNTALGSRALNANTTGFHNTAVGRSAMLFNTEGGANVAVGIDALQDNTTGNDNTGIGSFALIFNTTGNNNTATGFAALGGFAAAAGTADNNTANGANALASNTTGSENTAVGSSALFSNTEGNWNTASGAFALSSNVTGIENTAYGQVALQNVTGSKNIGIGAGGGCKLTTGSNNIAIENPGVAGESDTIRIGNIGTETNCADFPLPAHTATYIAGISGTAVVGDAVVVNANGQLGTATSSARFKKEIKPMDDASETILALNPVIFQYESDSKGTPQFGLIAEEVAKVNPDLVVHDRNGAIYSVRYEAVNAMLLNEFLKEHRKNEEQEATILRLQKQIQALTAGLQKVSAQLELSKGAPQTVLNGQ